MSLPDRDTLETVEKLLVERRKISGWMAALDGRRGETPPAVYRRVHDDYAVKMDKVQGKLAAASEAVQAVAGDVASRLIEKEQALESKREERAEVELRAAVGEYSEREWEKRRTRLDDELAAAVADRDGLLQELGRLRAVLSEATGIQAEPETADSDLTGACETVLAATEVAHEPIEEYPAPVEEATAMEPAPPAIAIQEQSVIAAVEPVVPLGPSFDELAFLKTVVGRPTPLSSPRVPAAPAPQPVAPAAASSSSAPAPRDSRGAYEVPEPQDAYPDPMPEPRVSQEMTPPRESFFGRPTPRSSEAVKSLKCQECGTLNFPTEWYCERCGGELAAM